MSIEVAVVISGISLAFGLYQGVSNLKRSEKQEVKADTIQLTTVIVKLESISEGITDLKSELNSMKVESKDNRERLIKVEESAKQAHQRLDELCGRKRDE